MQDIASCMSGCCNSSPCDQMEFLHRTPTYMHLQVSHLACSLRTFIWLV